MKQSRQRKINLPVKRLLFSAVCVAFLSKTSWAQQPEKSAEEPSQVPQASAEVTPAASPVNVQSAPREEILPPASAPSQETTAQTGAQEESVATAPQAAVESALAEPVSEAVPQVPVPEEKEATPVQAEEASSAQAAPTAPEVSSESTSEPAQTQEVSTPAVPAAPKEGITTLDLDEGNWFLKRQALEKTMAAIEELNGVFTKILDLRMVFLESRNKVDREFDLFAKETGFELGDISQLIAGIIDRMEEERKAQGQLDEEEREWLAQMEKHRDELKQLQVELTSITDMDASIDDVLGQVEQEIDQSHTYQMQGWRNFQAIKKVLNDEKAEELALKTEGLLNNMKDIYSYLSGQLTTYFKKKIETLQSKMEELKKKLESFKSQEDDLRKALEKFVKEDRQKTEKEEEHEKAQLEEMAKKVLELEKQQQKSMSWLTIVDYIAAPFVWIWNFFKRLF